MTQAWRNVKVEEIDGHWHAKAEYYEVETGETVHAFDTTFIGCSSTNYEEQCRAEVFVSRLQMHRPSVAVLNDMREYLLRLESSRAQLGISSLAQARISESKMCPAGSDNQGTGLKCFGFSANLE